MVGIDSLRDVLELECRKGYSNKAVIGGLDKYLCRQAGQIRQAIANPKLLAGFDELGLANSNYGSWDVDKRREWVMKAFDWLDMLESQSILQVRQANIIAPNRNLERGIAKTKRTGGKSEELSSPITAIRGISATTSTKFAKLGVKTVHDLLYFFPRRYIDYSQRKPIAELEEGEEQSIVALVWQARVATFGGQRGTEAIVGDETGNIRVVWFNQPYLARRFRTNARVVISGRVSSFKGQKVFESPEWELLDDKEPIHTGRLVPVYCLTHGLYPRQVRKWTKEAIDGWIFQVNDFLPSEIKRRCDLLDLPQAIAQAHYPDDAEMAQKARERLAFDELFLLQLAVLARKRYWQESQPGNPFNVDQEIIDRFLGQLPFTLTQAQERVLNEILADLKQAKAMSRLLQGEVGSGKTVIATLALLLAAANRFQGALMAPTEVLARQHFSNICNYLAQVGAQESSCGQGEGFINRYDGILSQPLTVALLVGSLSNSEKEELHRKVMRGEVDIVIGTHALIQEKVEFCRLGLAVIDEQHRFGVLQRSALRQKGFNPHVLVMTATPIPRTMALTLYGDLDLSVIDELPPGRHEVKTKWLKPQYAEKAYAFIRHQVSAGGRAFIVCPLVEESEALEAKAVTTEYERMSREVFPDLKLGLLHGRMLPREKEDVMRRFRAGELDILVSTSVVEVGIDVPRATVMLIEGADHFGLSQLHQLRGRVGRDGNQAYCLLVPEKLSPEIRERLNLIERTHNGFALAEEDLRLRGPGEFFGILQSGLPNLKVAKLSDLHLLELARCEAINLLQDDPHLEKAEHCLLREKLTQAWPENTEWS